MRTDVLRKLRLVGMPLSLLCIGVPRRESPRVFIPSFGSES
jgi:hypothetical protein